MRDALLRNPLQASPSVAIRSVVAERAGLVAVVVRFATG
jgi:hypothetical protein